MLLVAHHLEGGVGKDAGGHDVLLHEANEQHHLRVKIIQRIVTRKGPEGYGDP